ncbi:MAG: acyltransferase family protein, partial [Pseudonocardiaceae bacterium]
TVLIDGLTVCLPPFFVMSGMFLYRPFARAIFAGTKRPAAVPFVWARVLRLVPAYYVLVVASLLLLNANVIDGVWYVLRPILMIHYYVPNVAWVTGIEPTWTVPTELLFYLTLPVMAWIIHRYARRAADPASKARRMLVPLAFYLVGGALWTIFIYLPDTQQTVMTWSMWYWPFGYWDAFGVGMIIATLAAYAEHSKKTPGIYRFVQRHPNALWLAAGAIFLVNLPRVFGPVGMGDWAAFRQEQLIHYLVLLFGGLVILQLSVPNARSRVMDPVLNFTPIRYLGRISYGVYLWHIFALDMVMEQGSIFGNVPTPSPMLRGQFGFWELELGTLALTIAIATVSYYVLERPIERWRTRKNLTAAQMHEAAAAPVTPIAEKRTAATVGE